jgi:O-antigen/teichoic acid export membrane protein
MKIPNRIDIVEKTTQPVVAQDRHTTRLAKGASISLIGKMMGRGLYMFGQIILARILGPEAFGLYALGWTIMRIGGFIAPLGLQNGVIRFGSRYWGKEKPALTGVILQSIGLAFISGLLMGGCSYFAAPWLAETIFQKPGLTLVLQRFSLALPLIAGLSVATAATQVSQRMEYTVYVEEITLPAVNLFLILLFCSFGWGLKGATTAAVISFGVAFILVLHYVKKLFFVKLFSFRLALLTTLTNNIDLLIFSIPTALAGIFSISLIWVDRLIIGYFLPAAEVGVYQATSQTSIIFGAILSAFSAIFSPMIANLYYNGETNQLERLFRISAKWGLYLSLPFALIMIVAPGEVLTVVFGSEYAAGAIPLRILTISQLINVGTGAVGYLLIMTGHQNRYLFISGIALIVNIVLNWLFVPLFGLTGAALATTCAIGGLYLTSLIQVRCILGLWPYNRQYRKGLFATMLVTSALFLLNRSGIDSSILYLFLALIISYGMFGTILILLGLDSEDKEFIHPILNMASPTFNRLIRREIPHIK